MPKVNLPKPTLLTTEELKEILKTNEQLICGSREVSDKNCSNCIYYHCEPMQGGSVDVCTAKKGEFYGSYVIKNINNICPKYETPFMRKNKQKSTKNKQDITKIKEEMVGYKYKHYKNGKIYLVLDIVIHTETQELMVVYRNINDEQVWCRPLSIFNEEIDNEHHKRFEKIDDDSDWKHQQEQAIFKEFEENWAIVENNEYYLILVNDWDNFLEIDKREKRYECYYCRQLTADKNRYSALIDWKTHNLIHQLATLWGWNLC